MGNDDHVRERLDRAVGVIGGREIDLEERVLLSADRIGRRRRDVRLAVLAVAVVAAVVFAAVTYGLVRRGESQDNELATEGSSPVAASFQRTEASWPSDRSVLLGATDDEVIFDTMDALVAVSVSGGRERSISRPAGELVAFEASPAPTAAILDREANTVSFVSIADGTISAIPLITERADGPVVAAFEDGMLHVATTRVFLSVDPLAGKVRLGPIPRVLPGAERSSTLVSLRSGDLLLWTESPTRALLDGTSYLALVYDNQSESWEEVALPANFHVTGLAHAASTSDGFVVVGDQEVTSESAGSGGRDSVAIEYDQASDSWSEPIHLSPQPHTPCPPVTPASAEDTTLIAACEFAAIRSNGTWRMMDPLPGRAAGIALAPHTAVLLTAEGRVHTAALP